ncbi:hypothetical protein Tco_0757978 [Tanacetum coccineum]
MPHSLRDLWTVTGRCELRDIRAMMSSLRFVQNACKFDERRFSHFLSLAEGIDNYGLWRTSAVDSSLVQSNLTDLVDLSVES